MFITNYSEEKYNQTFESIYNYFKNQKEQDTNYTINHLQKFLELLYANEGNDWTGRGELKDVTNSATIAACEVLLKEWESELSKNL